MRWLGLFLAILVVVGLTSRISAQIPYNYTPEKPQYNNPNSIYWPDTTVNKKRVAGVGCIIAGGYTVAYTGLALAWYKNEPKVPFHLFNDLHEWSQMDKTGHILGGYQGGRAMIALFKWAGMDRKSTSLWGGLAGGLAMVPLEYFDGRAEKWGASVSDAVADMAGGALASVNELAWSEQRLQLKISYHPTGYAELRPDLFGDPYSRYLKDYNGHTLWLSARVHSWLPEGKFKEKYPRWLNIAVGYGAEGLYGGYGDHLTQAVKDREFRQYYLAFDIDLSNIKTKSAFLDFLLSTVNFVHLPSPTVEFNGRRGIVFHWLYM